MSGRHEHHHDERKSARSGKKADAGKAWADEIDTETHRQVLKFINQAVRVEDLLYGPPETVHSHPTDPHPEHHAKHKDHERKAFMLRDQAEEVLKFRDQRYPLGIRHWRDLLDLERFRPDWLDDLVSWFGARMRGRWEDFPQDIPRRGDGTRDGVVHAAMLKTGRVLFITADETTLLWNPEDATVAAWEDPVNQPHTMPGGYSLLCGHHVQLSDENGSILAVGGGGYGPDALAKAGHIFDPISKSWHRSANDMASHKWYPTAVSLGGKKILVVGGAGGLADIEIFDEISETFSPISGDDKEFPNLYPGLHLLPSKQIFYSRTGWGTAGAGPGGTFYTDPTVQPNRLEGGRSAYFTLNGGMTGGTWQKIATSPINRTKGMSVMLLSSTAPHARILVLGGADASSNDTYEIIDVSTMSPIASWQAWQPVPDGEHRSLPSGVLLPDGNLFVCGGIQSTNSPCTMFDPQTNSWSPMASLPSIRDYHSVALLLPSGKVMMAGWNNPKIEIYSPPYLFRGARPQITDAPDLVHHGATFEIDCPEAAEIARVVFVRPIAVTHQTDSEQRVIELLPKIFDPAQPGKLTLTAPDGGHPHPMAPRGNYMMFAVKNNGVPSIARWVYLH